MLGREAKKREVRRATSQDRLKQTKSVDNRGPQMQEHEDAAKDHADTGDAALDASKFDKTGGTVTGPMTIASVVAPSQSDFTLATTATGSKAHGLGYAPFMWFAQYNDGAGNWQPIADGSWNVIEMWADTTNVYVYNGFGSTYAFRVRVLG